jgi:hypothetical protein
MQKLTSLIREPNNKYTLIKSEFVTTDIVQAILLADRYAYKDVQNFAVNIPVSDEFAYCKAIYDFLFKNIQFQEDNLGYQGVQMPGKLWSSKKGDCKSFSIFLGALLKSRGISYSYRFVSYRTLPIWTHVYVIAHLKNGQNVILDCVYKIFNREKPKNYFKDYAMKGLYNVSGINGRVGVLQLPNKNEISEADLEAAIIKQRYEIERDIMAGIGRTERVEEYDNALNVINAFVGAIHNDDYELADSIVEGIGDIGKGKGRGKALLKKVVATAKKGVKILTKAVTAPARLAMKGILEISLPKSAPFFLYLFIAPDQLSKFPQKVQDKRKKVEKIANFIVEGVGMKRPHLMGILRNGIMKRYKTSPENVLAGMMTKKIAGIGDIGLIDDVIKVVVEVIGFISKLFKGKKSVDKPSANDVPSADDFGDMDTETGKKLASENKTAKEENNQEGANGDEMPEQGAKSTKGFC